MALAMSTPTNRSPSASMLASLCRRAICAENGSVHTTQRAPGTLFAAIEMPIPEPQTMTPRSASPPTTRWAAREPQIG